MNEKMEELLHYLIYSLGKSTHKIRRCDTPDGWWVLFEQGTLSIMFCKSDIEFLKDLEESGDWASESDLPSRLKTCLETGMSFYGLSEKGGEE